MSSRKKYLLLVLAIILLSGFVFVRSRTSQTPKSVVDNNTAINTPDGSRYVEYSSGILNKFTDKKRVLFFYANWCPTCLPANESFQKNTNNIPEDVVVIRVNYSDGDTDKEEKDLAKKYGVGYQHTYVQIDSNGDKINVWNGGGLEELLTNLK